MAGSSFDLVVLGAGPSGATAALRLARAGARVAIVDGSHPREKPCGGGITRRALALVADVVSADHLPHVQVRTAAFVDTATGARASIALDRERGRADAASLTVASRAAFDAALLAGACRAGVTFVQARARSVLKTRRGFDVICASGERVQADYLVGADGANSLARRTLLSPFRRDQLSVATGFFAHGCTSDEIVLEFTSDPPGYVWSFPRPDHLAIGICAQADSGITAADLRARTAAWIRASRLAPAARLEAYSWPIPSLAAGDFNRLPVAGPGWCLLGDAAGLVDPVTREGIFFALQSAHCAAEALEAGAARAERIFTARVRDEIGAELSRAARFKTGFFRPQFIALLMEALTSSAPIRQVVADLVAGEQPYRGLKWRLARTMELGLAVKLVLSAEC